MDEEEIKLGQDARAVLPGKTYHLAVAGAPAVGDQGIAPAEKVKVMVKAIEGAETIAPAAALSDPESESGREKVMVKGSISKQTGLGHVAAASYRQH